VPGPDSVKVIQKARALLAQARSGADFAKLARENSQDYGSAVQGGELGWASKDRYVKPFCGLQHSETGVEILLVQCERNSVGTLLK